MKTMLSRGYLTLLINITVFTSLTSAACISSGNDTTINKALKAAGIGGVVQLCASSTFTIYGTISFAAKNQELSTSGYPTGSTRATIRIAASPANQVSTLINGLGLDGIRIKSLIVDGNRPNAGLALGGGANIEVGQSSNGLIISNVASKNPRAWSCMHVMESGSTTLPCINATVINNDIGPCGNQGFDSNGNSLWADGISFACTKSKVANNQIIGSTDGGIVIFGAPGTAVTGNTITSSKTDRGFGAINMVDATYNGNYSGVTVSNNVIVGQKMFNVGIAIGSSVWGNDAGSYYLSGPATLSNNTFSGNITFPIALNGWQNGISITKSIVSTVTKPNSKFADQNDCSSATQIVFTNGTLLTYWSPNVIGPATLPGFTNAAANPNYFLCATPILPTSVSFAPNGLVWSSDQGRFADLHNGIVMQYQGDSNIVILNNTTPGGSTVLWASGHTVPDGCGSPSLCDLIFQGDGNLVTYFNGTPEWYTGTNPLGTSMLCLNKAPWIEILNSQGKVIWNTTMNY